MSGSWGVVSIVFWCFNFILWALSVDGVGPAWSWPCSSSSCSVSSSSSLFWEYSSGVPKRRSLGLLWSSSSTCWSGAFGFLSFTRLSYKVFMLAKFSFWRKLMSPLCESCHLYFLGTIRLYPSSNMLQISFYFATKHLPTLTDVLYSCLDIMSNILCSAFESSVKGGSSSMLISTASSSSSPSSSCFLFMNFLLALLFFSERSFKSWIGYYFRMLISSSTAFTFGEASLTNML